MLVWSPLVEVCDLSHRWWAIGKAQTRWTVSAALARWEHAMQAGWAPHISNRFESILIRFGTKEVRWWDFFLKFDRIHFASPPKLECLPDDSFFDQLDTTSVRFSWKKNSMWNRFGFDVFPRSNRPANESGLLRFTSVIPVFCMRRYCTKAFRYTYKICTNQVRINDRNRIDYDIYIFLYCVELDSRYSTLLFSDGIWSRDGYRFLLVDVLVWLMGHTHTQRGGCTDPSGGVATVLIPSHSCFGESQIRTHYVVHINTQQ